MCPAQWRSGSGSGACTSPAASTCPTRRSPRSWSTSAPRRGCPRDQLVHAGCMPATTTWSTPTSPTPRRLASSPRRLEAALGRPPRTLLDLACGTGRHAAEFAATRNRGHGRGHQRGAARPRAPARSGHRVRGPGHDRRSTSATPASTRSPACSTRSATRRRNERVLAALGGAQRHLAAERSAGRGVPARARDAGPRRAAARPALGDTGGGELLRISETGSTQPGR